MKTNFNSVWKDYKDQLLIYLEEILITFVWCVGAIPLGIITGLLGGAFGRATLFVTSVRIAHPAILFLLPIGAMVVTFIYHLANYDNDGGTNLVITAVQGKNIVPLRMTPLIFIAATFSHFCGASVGRVGSTFQMGGSVGYFLATKLKLKKDAKNTIIICAIGGVFSAMFGTPITGAFFALEAIAIGRFYAGALLPSIICSFTARLVGIFLGIPNLHYNIALIPDLNIKAVVTVALLGLLAALVGILYCLTITETRRFANFLFKNPYIKGLVLGSIILALTLLLGPEKYNGIGAEIVNRAIAGDAAPYDFFFKILFTGICLAAGYKGGEVYPAIFIGVTFGAAYGNIVGFSPSFAAALGLCALFCAITNCPITAFILSLELFGLEGAFFYLLVIGVSYAASGYTSIYAGQEISEYKYSK